MPDPIAGSDPSSSSFESDNACDPEIACCTTPTAPAEGSPHSVTVGPVYVMGESDSAARELVRRHDASPPADCGTERDHARLSCFLAASAAGGTVAMSPSGIGLVMGALTTAGLAAQCAGEISSVLACEERARAVANANADCAARDGVLLAGVNSELICLVVR